MKLLAVYDPLKTTSQLSGSIAPVPDESTGEVDSDFEAPDVSTMTITINPLTSSTDSKTSVDNLQCFTKIGFSVTLTGYDTVTGTISGTSSKTVIDKQGITTSYVVDGDNATVQTKLSTQPFTPISITVSVSDCGQDSVYVD